VEIFKTDFGAEVYDTPGYTSFEGIFLNEDELSGYFPDIDRYRGQCRFDNCRHINEPGCMVLAAMEDGLIAKSRYDSYVRLLGEARERNRKGNAK
jgi:ribosome biogenesis GTPase